MTPATHPDLPHPDLPSAPAERAVWFFTDMLPAAVQDGMELFDQGPGTLAVFVEGSGSWTVAFGDALADTAVQEGASFDADCVAVFSTPAFSALLETGALADVQPPVVIGDERLLTRLGELFLPRVRASDRLESAAALPSAGSKRLSAAQRAGLKKPN